MVAWYLGNGMLQIQALGAIMGAGFIGIVTRHEIKIYNVIVRVWISMQRSQ
jgi:hypothetical protein